MGMWGGGGGGAMGGGASGWSQNIAGGSNQMGPSRTRGADGWDDEELGKALDAEVLKRLIPYLKEYKIFAAISVATMFLTAIAQFVTPLMSGFVVRAAIRGDQHMVMVYAAIMITLAFTYATMQMTQQLITGWMGTRILRKLQSSMYDHIQNLSLSFFDEMEVGRIISRLTSDVQVVQDLLTTGSLSSLSNVVGITIVVGISSSMCRNPAFSELISA